MSSETVMLFDASLLLLPMLTNIINERVVWYGVVAGVNSEY